MKKALRDVLLILALFGAILVAPLVMDALSSGKDDAPVAKAKPQPQQEPQHADYELTSSDGRVTKEGMPPQPEPAVTNDKASAIDNLTSIEEAVSKKPIDTDLVITPMDATNCPVSNIGGQQDYDPKIETRKSGDSFIMPAASVAKGTIDGAGGVDTIKITDGGSVDVDGKHLISIEIYDIRNDQPNALRIFAAGLATMNGRHAIVIGDKNGSDIVALDPCLQWNDPIAIEDGPEPLLRYDAYDKAGNQASVSVTDGVKVTKGK